MNLVFLVLCWLYQSFSNWIVKQPNFWEKLFPNKLIPGDISFLKIVDWKYNGSKR